MKEVGVNTQQKHVRLTQPW